MFLDRLTLLASTREQAGGFLAAMLGLTLDDDDSEEALTQLANSAVFAMWPLVEAITDPDAVIGGWERPGEHPEPAVADTQDGRPSWQATDNTSRWRVSLADQRPGLRAVKQDPPGQQRQRRR
uniref:hypothetical protein n=1 Tax=Kitasatospora sp. NBC_01519 TaxID=2903576 RepID=UPI002F91B47A